jgi:uncharacterized protein (DUF697 family)
MSWVNDLASSLGIPAGAATLAVAMYGACAAAEKAARPEALAEIGRILKDTSWERSMSPSAIVERVFRWTFGERHLSWRCAATSATATLSFFSAYIFYAIIVIYRGGNFWHDFLMIASSFEAMGRSIYILALYIVGTIVADYIALAKTRALLRWLQKMRGQAALVSIIPLDVALSILISILGLESGILVVALAEVGSGLISATSAGYFISSFGIFCSAAASFLREIAAGVLAFFEALFGIGGSNGAKAFGFFTCSTLLTSIWTILILLSAAVIKLLSPLQNFTAWLFNVDRHPLQAVGIVSAILVVAGSLIWTVLRAVI